MEQVLIYLAIFALVFIINLVGKTIYKKNKLFGNTIILISFIILLIFSGCRYYVGTDYQSYLKYYTIISKLNWNELNMVNWELGASLLFKFTSVVFNEPKMCIFMLSLLTILPIYHANKLYNYRYLPLSVLMFCCIFLPFSMNGMRQAVAMSYVLLAFAYLIKDKKIHSFIYLIVAFLFHQSCILIVPYFILFVFFKNKKFERYSIFITLGISIFILFFGDLLEKYNIMIDYYTYLKNVDLSLLSFHSLLTYIPIIFIILFFENKNEKEIKTYKGLIINGLIFEIVGSTRKYLSRISLYFVYFEILLIPILIGNVKNKTMKYILYVGYILYIIIYFIYEFYTLGRHDIFPYQTWIGW